MNLYDRIQATVRCPQYFEELKNLYRTLKRKCGGPKEYVSLKFVRSLIKDYKLPEVKQFVDRWQIPEVIDPANPDDKPLLESWIKAANKKPRRTAYPMGVQRFINNRYLHLKVDLRERTDVLSTFFSECVKYHKQQLPVDLLPDGRDKNTYLDPWEIYDEIHYKRKKIFQVFQKKFKTKEHPSTSQKAKNEYKQIEAAFNKAVLCITKVVSDQSKFSPPPKP